MVTIVKYVIKCVTKIRQQKVVASPKKKKKIFATQLDYTIIL